MNHPPAAGAMSQATQACIADCTGCHSVCLTTITYCLGMGGAHAAPAHIRLLLDCADICRVSADFLLRGSDLHTATCAACATVCEACAADCARLAGGDAIMEGCAESCRRCADSCRAMAGGGAR